MGRDIGRWGASVDCYPRPANKYSHAMSAFADLVKKPLAAPLVAAAGLLLAFAAWSLPVNLKSVSPALLREAGAGTPSLAQFGRELVDSEKIGPATLTLAAARSIGDPGAGGPGHRAGRPVRAHAGNGRVGRLGSVSRPAL